MSLMPLNIVGGATFGRYGKISQENTYNMFVTDNALVPYLGYVAARVTPGSESRGLYFSPIFNVMLHIIDSNVYIVDTKLNYQLVGAIETSTGLVYITSNNANQFCISDLSNLYIYTYGGAVVIVPRGTTNLPTDFLPGYIDFQDGYFVCGDRNSSSWNLSHLNDGNNWDILDSDTGLSYAANYETKPDTIQATVAFNRMLFVMGNTGTEMWRDVGDTLFPYQRDNYFSIDYGVYSIGTVAEGFGVIAWLGKNEFSNPVILSTTGGIPTPISTDGINFILDDLQYPEQSSAFIFQNSVHIFYQITFYGDNLTLVYDFTTSTFFTMSDENLNYHIAKRICHFNDTYYFIAFGNDGNGNVVLYETGSQFTTYDGKTIPRYRVCAPVRQPTAQQFKIKNVSVTMEQGATNQLQKVGLSMCKNGGFSFGTTVMNTCNAQAYGQNKMRWWQMGAANDVTFKFAFWSGNSHTPIRVEDGMLNERFVIIDAQVEVE